MHPDKALENYNQESKITQENFVYPIVLETSLSNERTRRSTTSANNLKLIQVKDIIKEVEDYLKTYSSAGMDISSNHVWNNSGNNYGNNTGNNAGKNTGNNNRAKNVFETDNANSNGTNNATNNVVGEEDLPQLLDSKRGPHVTNVLQLDVHEGPSEIRDTKIASLRLKFNAFKALEGEKVKETYTRLKVLSNELENKDVKIPQAELNATSVNGLPKKWLKLIDQIYESETKRFTIQSSTSKVLISNTHFQDSDSDVEEDTRSNNAFLADLNAEFHDKALLANQNRFYKRSGRVDAARKPIEKSIETCSYKALKAELALLTQKIDVVLEMDGMWSRYGVRALGFRGYSSGGDMVDEGTTTVKAFMAIIKDEPVVGKTNARSGQWVKITMKKVQILLTLNDVDVRKHVLYYNKVDLHYVEDQRKNLLSKFNSLKQDLSSCKSELIDLKIIKVQNLTIQHEVTILNLDNEYLKDEVSDLKKVIEKWTSSKPKDTTSSKDIVFIKAESVNDIQDPLPHLPKLSGAEPIDTSKDVITTTDLTQISIVSDKTKQVTEKESLITSVKKKAQTKTPYGSNPKPEKKADSTTEELLLTLMKEVKGLKEQIKPSVENSLSVSQTGSFKSGKNNQKVIFSRKALIIPKPFKPCKYYGFNDHHSDECEYYHGCNICGSIAHETSDCDKKALPINRRPRIATQQNPLKNSGCSRHMTWVKQYLHIYSKESGPIVVFGENSSGDIEGYGLVNCNGITFTRVAYVNGLKHNLINISQLCDVNYKVLLAKTQGTVFNQNIEVMLIFLKRRDVSVIDMSSYNEESNICFLAKASNSVNRLWHKRLSHLNFKNINKLAKQNLVDGLTSLTFSKYKPCSAGEEGKHHRASFKSKQSFSIYKCLHLLHMDLFGPVKPQTISYCKYTPGCPVFIHSHIDHLEKFNEKADDGFFLEYSLVAKAFRVFNIKRQEMEESFHVTFNEADEVIKHTNIKGEKVNFNENRSFPDDEFLVQRDTPNQYTKYDDSIPFVPAFDPISTNNITIPDTITSPSNNISPSGESPDLSLTDDQPILNEPDDLEPTDP
ncbi:retrovirus-related pol polyprotein from transposon TNT 1-94 [Tanacetum coccineum]|uniref:Retrovirus-related pol polyprotein from transposon TNT 1-94 n=1 Tax=Tanacetum coccineum TaxID=301880 RepID=A0ABQ5CUS0_9ASTR